jgi:hypothetical protein
VPTGKTAKRHGLQARASEDCKVIILRTEMRVKSDFLLTLRRFQQ